jgi:hypothetical protein
MSPKCESHVFSCMFHGCLVPGSWMLACVRVCVYTFTYPFVCVYTFTYPYVSIVWWSGSMSQSASTSMFSCVFHGCWGLLAGVCVCVSVCVHVPLHVCHVCGTV